MGETADHTDEQLLLQIRDGAEEGLSLAYRRHGPRAYAVALRILGDPVAAEDVTQDAFLRLWSTSDRLDASRGTLGGWLTTVTRNRAIDKLRSVRTRGETGTELHTDTLVGPEPTPLDAALTADSRQRVVTALESLPPGEREVLELSYFEGLTQLAIAERTGAPLGTVKGRTRNGLRRLRGALREFAGEVA